MKSLRPPRNLNNSIPYDAGISPLDKRMSNCLSECGKSCSNDDMGKGSNQKYSCIHACKMRELGLDIATCRVNCQRSGGSGCSPVVNGYQFNLCDIIGNADPDCNPPGDPPIAECELGCVSF